MVVSRAKKEGPTIPDSGQIAYPILKDMLGHLIHGFRAGRGPHHDGEMGEEEGEKGGEMGPQSDLPRLTFASKKQGTIQVKDNERLGLHLLREGRTVYQGGMGCLGVKVKGMVRREVVFFLGGRSLKPSTVLL